MQGIVRHVSNRVPGIVVPYADDVYLHLRDCFVRNGRTSQYDANVRARIVERFEVIQSNVTIASSSTDGLFLAEAALDVDAAGRAGRVRVLPGRQHCEVVHPGIGDRAKAGRLRQLRRAARVGFLQRPGSSRQDAQRVDEPVEARRLERLSGSREDQRRAIRRARCVHVRQGLVPGHPDREMRFPLP